jgi:membrane protein implicated in regulation of membrane protease activity
MIPAFFADLQLEPGWWWLILAVLLGIGEIFLPGIFLIWVAIAAAVTGVAALFIAFPPALQILLFALLSLAATWAGRRWYVGNPVPSQDPLLNDRGARLIGETVTVADPIINGEGRVRVGDSVWLCRGADAPSGSRVRIVGMEGPVLKVEPA